MSEQDEWPTVDIHDFDIVFDPDYPPFPQAASLKANKEYRKLKEKAVKDFAMEMIKLYELTRNGEEIRYERRQVVVVNRLAQYKRSLCQIPIAA